MDWAHIKEKNKVTPSLVLKAIDLWIRFKFNLKKLLGWQGKH